VLAAWTTFLHRVGLTRWELITAGVLVAAILPSFLKYGTIRLYDLLTFASVTTFVVTAYAEMHHPFGLVRWASKVVSLVAAIATAVVVVVGWTLLVLNVGGP
jgi:hypothetical protein